MPTIKAVLFDFGKVLTLSPNTAAWERMQKIIGLSDTELGEGYWALRDDYDEGRYTGDTYWQQVAGRTLSASEQHLLKAADVDLWTDMNQPMLAWVDELQAAGFRTGILSNMPDSMAQGICERFDWIAKFDHAVWSHAWRMRKPQPEIYTLAIEGLGVPAEQILFIDDKQENIDAAQAAGMRTIVYQSHEQFLTEMKAQGYDALLPSSQLLAAAQ